LKVALPQQNSNVVQMKLSGEIITAWWSVCGHHPTNDGSKLQGSLLCWHLWLPGNSLLATSSAMRSRGPVQGHPGSSSIPALL